MCDTTGRCRLLSAGVAFSFSVGRTNRYQTHQAMSLHTLLYNRHSCHTLPQHQYCTLTDTQPLSTNIHRRVFWRPHRPYRLQSPAALSVETETYHRKQNKTRAPWDNTPGGTIRTFSGRSSINPPVLQSIKHHFAKLSWTSTWYILSAGGRQNSLRLQWCISHECVWLQNGVLSP